MSHSTPSTALYQSFRNTYNRHNPNSLNLKPIVHRITHPTRPGTEATIQNQQRAEELTSTQVTATLIHRVFDKMNNMLTFSHLNQLLELFYEAVCSHKHISILLK